MRDCAQCETKHRLAATRERLARFAAHCTACKGPSDRFGGETHIEAGHTADCILRHVDAQAMQTARAPTATRVNIPDERETELLLRITAEFAALTDNGARLVVLRLRGHDDGTIASLMRTDPANKTDFDAQAVRDAWRRLAEENPIWPALLEVARRAIRK